MTKDAILQAVADAYDHGLCILPPAQDGSKRPDVPSWSAFQKERPTQAVLEKWYANGRTGVGWLCGGVSGNLEVFEFDDRSVYVEFKKVAQAAGLEELVERIEAGYLEHSPNGAHWPYFCSEVSGNTKLAKKAIGAKKYKSLIETRGEGGFIIVAPTFGSVNRSGSYTLVRGSISTIATITPKERQQLHDLARVFDESPKRQQEPQVPTDIGDDPRPGDDYAAATPWSEILEPHGWCPVYRRLDVTAWRRPGRSCGISATTNYNGSELLYVFSTSTLFESNRGINKFAAYAALNHDGDFRKAAGELRLLGFGAEETLQDIDISGITGEINKNAASTSTRKFPAELLRVPGMVGDLAEFINSTSSKPQPVLALAASIAAMATIIGRKVRTETFLRSNIYVLGVVETGAGKERARQAVRAVFNEAGASQRAAYDDMSSDAAIISAVSKTPSCLFMLDEIGRTLKAIASDRAPHYLSNTVSLYLKLYGAADGVFYGKTYADPKKWAVIEQPNLSIYGTTVPARLFESMTRDQVADGFLSRFLVFESDDPDPDYREVLEQSPPATLVEQFARWECRSENDHESAGNIEKATKPNPRLVPATTKARSIFNDLENDMKNIRTAMRDRGDDPGMYTRVVASARKLALIRACGIAFEEPEVTEADAIWGANLARHLFGALTSRVASEVSENSIEAMTKRLAGIIRAAGRKGIAKRDLTRKTQWLRRLERQDILATLEESHQIKQELTRVKKAKLTTFFWVGD